MTILAATHWWPLDHQHDDPPLRRTACGIAWTGAPPHGLQLANMILRVTCDACLQQHPLTRRQTHSPTTTTEQRTLDL
ncbi:MAG: hypothetical protein OXT70_03435 [Chloroflexota bacterium]|nr:hypothetical protein [Chloroflexota bacterium]